VVGWRQGTSLHKFHFFDGIFLRQLVSGRVSHQHGIGDVHPPVTGSA